MKKEIKNIIFVCVVAFILVFGLVLSAVFINLNIFESGKKVTIIINYSNRNYEYKNIKTKSENLYELLSSHNDKLELGFYVSGNEEIILFSLKSTDANSTNAYLISINGENKDSDLSKILLKDGDIITIDYVSQASQIPVLASGGDKKITYYDRVTISLSIIASIILIPTMIFTVMTLVNLRKNRHLEQGDDREGNFTET